MAKLVRRMVAVHIRSVAFVGVDSVSECSRIPKTLWWRTVAVVAALVSGGPGAFGQDYATDTMSGYALGGHDPVAYFIARQPLEGLARHELRWGGTIWVFANEGNRAAFEADPDVYAPHLAGCDPVALANGFVTEGNPVIFALYDGDLLLFHSEINRFLFLADPENQIGAARDNAARLGCVGRQDGNP
jgi:hypothetical protein